MIFLWTDGLFWLLFLICLGYALSQRRQKRTAARDFLLNSKMAISTLVILTLYGLIAMMDCIHFKLPGQTDIHSVLDLVLSPLNHNVETTYSPPFAVKGLNYPKAGSSLFDLTLICLLKATGLATLTSLIFFFILRQARRRGTALLTIFISVLLLAWMFFLSRHYHIMGTDKVGQDVFYQTIKSIRTGVLIGSLTTLVMFPFAIFFGTIAGYFKGWVDDLVQYVYTTLSSIPDVLLIVAFMLMLEMIMGRYPQQFANVLMRADFRLLALCLIFGLTSWTSLCRLLRAETFKIRELDYVKAGRVLGSSNASILTKHVIPNLMHIVFITLAMDFSGLVLAEAVLSYVGVGVDSSTYSWGNMINAARLELAREPMVWWSLTAAFIFMFLLVLSANLFADVLQKAYDPRARGSR